MKLSSECNCSDNIRIVLKQSQSNRTLTGIANYNNMPKLCGGGYQKITKILDSVSQANHYK